MRWRWLLTLLFPIVVHAQINTERVMLMGRNALYYEDYVLSIQRFNMVINAKPHLAEPYFFRGLAKFYLEDFMGADADCSQAIERNPYAEKNYVLRGLCRVNTQRYDLAEQDYEQSVHLNSRNANSWHNLTLCQIEQKLYDRADSTLDQMIKIWPKEAENYTLKAQIALTREDSTRALEWLDRSLEANPYEGPAWSMRAAISCNRGLYSQGEQELDKAILQLPRKAGLYINRALARYHQSNLRGAMSDYDAALEIEPSNYTGHFNRALLRAEVGDVNRSIEDFNFVINLEPDNTIALYNRALLLDKTGDFKGAIRDITAVISDYPEFWEGYRTRASIRRKIGDVYGAERDEFRVLKAEMEKRTGTYRSKTKTRKKATRNPEEYDKLVEEDPKEPEQEYASEYRGRVQDHASDLMPEPMYVLSFYRKESDIKRHVPYHDFVESLNQGGSLSRTVYLTDAEGVMTETDIQRHLHSITALDQQIEEREPTENQLLQRAMDYYHVRDFESATTDLGLILASHPDHQAALFLRAQMRIAQQMASVPAGTLPLSPSNEARIGYGQALEDLQHLLRLSPNLSAAQYNIGNVYVQLHQFDRAIEAYSATLELDPQFPEAYFNRGVIRLLDGHTNDGLSDLSQAGELGLYQAYNLIKKYSKDKK